eukprot:5091522-Amphidinium_carterae.3
MSVNNVLSDRLSRLHGPEPVKLLPGLVTVAKMTVPVRDACLCGVPLPHVEVAWALPVPDGPTTMGIGDPQCMV